MGNNFLIGWGVVQTHLSLLCNRSPSKQAVRFKRTYFILIKRVTASYRIEVVKTNAPVVIVPQVTVTIDGRLSRQALGVVTQAT